MNRCRWVNENSELYVSYHDTEWGVPVHYAKIFQDIQNQKDKGVLHHD
jgi:3-methyladenine DNA glycosylase Tag